MKKLLSIIIFLLSILILPHIVHAISPASSLIDDWSSGTISSSKWENSTGGHATVVNQQLSITTSGTNYYYIDSNGVNNYNLVGSSVSNQLINAGNQSFNSFETYPIFIKSSHLGAYYIAFFVNNNTVHARKEINGVNTEIHTASYNASTEQYFRIREASGTVYWDISGDGITWVNFTSVATSSLFDLTSVYIGQLAGKYNTESSETTAVFDNFNILPGGITPTPSPTIIPTPTPTSTPTPTPTVTPTPNPLRPDHIVVVVEENHQLQQTLGTGYFTQLASQGALMVQSFGIGHPSQPNYMALFSGSTQGTTDDTCPAIGTPFSTDNLGNQLLTNGFTFKGYSESMPASNPLNPCINAPWSRYHSPWLSFSNIPASDSAAFSSFPSDYTQLPTVSFVIPNTNNDAHDGTLSAAANWLQTNIEPYRAWAMTHNSLLIMTTDEDDDNANNLIYTAFAGQHIQTGIYNETITHYNILSTIEDLYGLPQLNSSSPIKDIFK